MKRPEVSVVMPAHNEAAVITEALNAIGDQSWFDQIKTEVLIVANDCSDGTENIVKDWQAAVEGQPFISSQLISTRRRGKQYALNIGLNACRGDVVVCTDADVTIGRGAIRWAAETLSTELAPRLVSIVSEPLDEYLPPTDPLGMFVVLKSCRSLATMPHKSVSGRFMGFTKGLSVNFPESAAPDDTWLSGFVGTRYGLEAIEVSNQHITTFIPPQNYNDYVMQCARYMAAFDLLKIEHPELQGYIDNLDSYKKEMDAQEDLYAKWGVVCRERYDVDLNEWSEAYLDDQANIKQRHADRALKSILANNGNWAPNVSTHTTSVPALLA